MAAVLSGTFFLSEQTEVWAKQPQIHHAHPDTEQRQAPISVDPLATEWPRQPQPNTQTYYYYPYTTDEPDKGSDAFLGISSGMWVAIFTFLLVAATFVQACLILRAESLTRKALRVSQRQLVRSKLDTRNMVEQSERHARQELRAYLGVISGSISVKNMHSKDGSNAGLGLEIKLTIKNSGRTPAYKMKGGGDIKFAKTFDPNWLLSAKSFAQGAYIVPDAEAHYIVLESLENLNASVTGNQPHSHIFFVFGKLEYIDAFDVERWVIFRYEITGDFARGKGGLQPCAEGNDGN